MRDFSPEARANIIIVTVVVAFATAALLGLIVAGNAVGGMGVLVGIGAVCVLLGVIRNMLVTEFRIRRDDRERKREREERERKYQDMREEAQRVREAAQRLQNKEN